jgi:hypothetical protein
MVDAATYVSELESKHHEAFRQLAASYMAAMAKENLSVVDALKLEMRAVIEAIEIAALWLPDSDELGMKIALAARCGDCARNVQKIADRLQALGVSPGSFDPRHGGYSKLFAFFRSLQTIEERSAAGFVTLGSLNILRFAAIATWSEQSGDAETAALYRGPLTQDEQRHSDDGRRLLIAVATGEESQARARRTTYRTNELVGELQDPALLRKFLLRSVKK